MIAFFSCYILYFADKLLPGCLQSLSEEVILTLGEAFEVAYQLALRGSASNVVMSSTHEPAAPNIPAAAATNSRLLIPYSTAL